MSADMVMCERCGEREMYDKAVVCMHCHSLVCMYCWQHEGVIDENDDYTCEKCRIARTI